MSWFLIYKGRNDRLHNKISQYFARYSHSEIYNADVYYDGREETLIHCLGNSDYNFIVSGLGIVKKDEYKFADLGDWKKLVESKKSVPRLNGHFAGCVIQEELITCFNDGLGLREIYYAKLDDAVLISTRTDLISRFLDLESPALDYIAGNWITSTPLFYKTFSDQINRLGPGGLLEFHQLKEPKVENKKFTAHGNNAETVEELLEKLTTFPLVDHKLSLGLSGGLDSRLLLSLLPDSPADNWRVHTFGSETMKDVCIAGEISAKLNLKHDIYNRVDISANDILGWIKSYIPFTGLTVPVSDFLHTYYHNLISDSGYVIIDGAFGEIARRQYLNRFRLNGRGIIEGKDTISLINNMRISKADIFYDEVRLQMESALANTTEAVWKEMDSVSTEDIYYWLDELMVRYKPANVFSYGQNSLDQISTAYMPFVQEELLENILMLPLQMKRNGKLFRKLIRDKRKKLTGIELVKDYITYPYQLGTVTSYAWRKVKQKASGIVKVDPIKYSMYDKLKEYIYDELNSSDIKEDSLIDKNKIIQAADSFYGGDRSGLGVLDWWLTFNEWRKINYPNNK